MKKEVDDFMLKKGLLKQESSRQSVPKTVEIKEIASSLTINSKEASEEEKAVEKNEKMILFIALLCAKPQFDRSGNIVSLLPGEISEEAMSLLTT